MLSLDKGDTVKLSVFANYSPEQNTHGNGRIDWVDFLALLTGTYTAVGGSEALTIGSASFDDPLVTATLGNRSSSENTDAPAAYLNYLFFDKDRMLTDQVGFEQVSSTASGTNWEELTLEMVAAQKGFLLVYLSNETHAASLVNMDDLTIYHGKPNVVSADDYYPGGLTFNSFTRSYSEPQKNLYQGKELQEETQLYDFHARMYDPAIWRTFQTDPMSESFYDHSPYSWLKNNLIGRIDPTGMTDFAFNKKTGDVTQVGEANDDPDRFVKTNRKGEVKYKKNGDARVAMGGIEKGILKDGQNFKNDDQVIDVGGEGQASLDGVEDFVTRFSEHVGVEIAGAYLSQEDGADANISKVIIDEYKGNKSKKSSMSLTGLFTDPSLKDFNTITAFHTHPSNLTGVSRTDVERPSGTTDGRGDLGFRRSQASYFYNFLILTRTATYPSKVQRIPFTNWKK